MLAGVRQVDPTFMTRHGAAYRDILKSVLTALPLVSPVAWRRLGERQP